MDKVLAVEKGRTVSTVKVKHFVLPDGCSMNSQHVDSSCKIVMMTISSETIDHTTALCAYIIIADDLCGSAVFF